MTLLHTKVVSVTYSTHLNRIQSCTPVISHKFCQITMYPRCTRLMDWLWPQPHTPHLPIERRAVVWVSCCSLHSWEFLCPVLFWDPCPLKLQFLSDVFLLTLLEECTVLVAEGRQKVEYLFYRIHVDLTLMEII